MSLEKDLRQKFHPASGRLPEFVIIGTAKSATTSVMATLNKHRDIYIPAKEINFFGKKTNLDKGLDWYKSHFKSFRKLCGDKSPGYIYFTECHERMAQMVPDAKLILFLREPVKRAISNYQMRVYKGNMELDEKGDVLSFEKLFHNYKKLDNAEKQKFPYDIIHRGLYIDQIENLLKYFNKKQLYIGITEHLAKEPEKYYRHLTDFLGISPIKTRKFSKKRVGKYPKAEIEDTVIRDLKDFYKVYNNRLFSLLGYSIPEWE